MQRFFSRLMARFTAASDGSVIILVAVSLFLILIVVGGAVDFSRYLIVRTQAQSALDNAVISAAAVKDTQNVTSVANRFFDANFPDVAGNNDPVVITLSDGDDVVTGTVRVSVDAMFGAFVGINEYSADLLAQTITSANGTEIVLTIDNSPSMCMSSPFGGAVQQDPGCRKLNAIKEASTDFVNIVMEDDPDDVYIGLVPFNHNINMNPSLGKHPLLGDSIQNDGGPTDYLAGIMELNDDRSELIDHIASMDVVPKTWGFTRTNVGTLVAGLMLMPYEEDKIYFRHNPGLPQEFNPGRLDKILVLMTDGENVTRFREPAHPRYVPENSEPDNFHQGRLCETLREHYGVIIYSVTYDMPDGEVKDVFRECATNSQFYFDVVGSDDLAYAYQIIAESIKHIRLHQ